MKYQKIEDLHGLNLYGENISGIALPNIDERIRILADRLKNMDPNTNHVILTCNGLDMIPATKFAELLSLLPPSVYSIDLSENFRLLGDTIDRWVPDQEAFHSVTGYSQANLTIALAGLPVTIKHVDYTCAAYVEAFIAALPASVSSIRLVGMYDENILRNLPANITKFVIGGDYIGSSYGYINYRKNVKSDTSYYTNLITEKIQHLPNTVNSLDFSGINFYNRSIEEVLKLVKSIPANIVSVDFSNTRLYGMQANNFIKFLKAVPSTVINFDLSGNRLSDHYANEVHYKAFLSTRASNIGVCKTLSAEAKTKQDYERFVDVLAATLFLEIRCKLRNRDPIYEDLDMYTNLINQSDLFEQLIIKLDRYLQPESYIARALLLSDKVPIYYEYTLEGQAAEEYYINRMAPALDYYKKALACKKKCFEPNIKTSLSFLRDQVNADISECAASPRLHNFASQLNEFCDTLGVSAELVPTAKAFRMPKN